MDFLYASAEVHTLPPRKRLGNVLRDVAHSPTDLGSKKARLAGGGDACARRCAIRDSWESLCARSRRRRVVRFSGTTAMWTGTRNRSRRRGETRARRRSRRTGRKDGEEEEKLTTKSERSTTPVLVGDDETTSTGEPKEMTDEEMAMKLHLEMNALLDESLVESVDANARWTRVV